MRNHEEHVPTRSITRPLAKIFVATSWALALARRRARCGGRCGVLGLPALSVTLLLGAAALASLRADAITLTGLGTTPAPGRLLAGGAAITALRMRGRKPALATFEQAAAATYCPLPCTEKLMQ